MSFSLKRRGLGLAAGALAVAALGAVAVQAYADPEADSGEAVDPLPRIATSTDGESLVVGDTGEEFTPRGYNYVRLAPRPSDPEKTFHSTFEPGMYDPERADATLAALSANGHNTVRVFTDPGWGPDSEMGQPHGLGHGADDNSTGNPEYLDNVADFVERAAGHGLYVLPSLDVFPQNAHYTDIIGGFDPNQINISGYNLVYMFDGYVKAREEFMSVFASEMKERLGPLTSTFLALQFDNEAHFSADEKPFEVMSGTVKGLDGVEYDMSNVDQRQQAADNSMSVYSERLAAAVRDVDPDMMTTLGVFTNKAVNKDGFDGFAKCEGCGWDKDFRYPVRLSTLSKESSLDFLSVHTYPAPGQFTLEESLNSIEWSEIEGPVINGEFGALRERYGGDVGLAAEAMRTHQVESCALGMDGWLFWTWDTDDDATQQLFFRGNEADGAIDAQLSPANRPDPCENEAS
ncbi:MAG: cellulase family glycosylhydrolase [Stackebrandtia sp.]